MKLCILLIFHIMGDFVFQTSRMAQAKQKKGEEGRMALIKHAMIYTGTAFLSTLWWGYWWETLFLTLFLSVGHAVVDAVFLPLRRRLPQKQLHLFLMDQAIHVAMLIGASQLLGAIGFVLAAKSLARFQQLNDDKDFAERYLVGTLVSTLVAVACVLAWNCLQ